MFDPVCVLQQASLQRFIFFWVYYTNSTKLRWGRVYYIIDFRQLRSVKSAFCILKEVDCDLTWGGGGFTRLCVLGNYCLSNPPLHFGYNIKFSDAMNNDRTNFNTVSEHEIFGDGDFPSWLTQQQISLACTTYQTSRLMLRHKPK
jgi:hypothetical protein